MVGRTPEYLGKKIEAFEMKMASLVILIPPLLVLVGTAIAVAGPGLHFTDPATGEVKSPLNNPGAHGFSEVLYAFSSAGNNNGSAFAGLNANTPFYNIVLGHGDVGRALLADDSHAGDRRLAGAEEIHAAGSRHAADASPLFVVMLVSTILLVGALTFVPALALGPIVEHLQMLGP